MKHEFKNEGKNLELKIYGTIEQSWWKDDEDDSITSVEDLEKMLKDHKDVATIDIYINSSGGSVFDGVAMYNILKRHKAYKRVFIDGFACSVASVIAMAGNTIVMPKTSMMMIHNAWVVTMGNANELRKMAEDLDKINEMIKNSYRTKMKIDDDKLNALMDSESYLTADECLEYGLCTKIDDSLDTKEEVEKGLETMTGLYENKLKTLTALKNAIKDIEEVEEETKEVETVELETGEVETIEEVKETEEVKEEEVVNETEIEDTPTDLKEEVKNIKENALKAFFNLGGK